jgi:hypothetical protein
MHKQPNGPTLVFNEKVVSTTVDIIIVSCWETFHTKQEL